MNVEKLINEVKLTFTQDTLNNEYFESMATRIDIPNKQGEFKGDAIVVWGDEDLDSKYYVISIRENSSPDDWGNELICESTDNNSYEQLEVLIKEVVNKFYKL